MTSSLFPELPDDARLWVYTTSRVLTADEQESVQDQLASFFSEWTAHGHRVKGRAAILDDRFLLIAATVPGGDLSGCGIDASTQVLKQIAETLHLEWLPALNVACRDDDGRVQVVPRPSFRAAAREGKVDADTRIFDTSITTVGELRSSGFEKAASDSWHVRVFRLDGPVAT